MRIRAGIILIEEGKIALMERHRAGRHYFSFPGGGVDMGETVEQAAVREAKEELGVDVVIRKKVAETIQNGRTHQYFLVEWVGGVFGTGTGEEFTKSHPNDPWSGVYIPMWMPIEELSTRENVFPADIARVVAESKVKGWGE